MLFSCLAALLLSSCSPSLFRNFRSQTGATGNVNDFSWFRGDGESLLSRASINAWSSEFTGVMIVKQVSDSYRCLFMTETGLKIFDLEVRKDGSHTMHYSIEQLERKSVRKLLARDLGLMIFPFSGNGNDRLMREGRDGPPVIKSKDDRGKRFIWLNDNGRISRIISSGPLFRKFQIDYHGTGTMPDAIMIKHSFLKISINLTRIDDVAK